MKKKHGWIRQENNTGKFVMVNCCESIHVQDAYVFSTRKEARESTDPMFKMNQDIVRKVKVNKQGKAVNIIPGR